MNNMRIVVVKPGMPAYEAVIGDSLEEMQEVVGGLIEVADILDDDVAIICNEEGKLIGLPPNRVLEDTDGQIMDILYGTFFLVSAPMDSDTFESLSDELVKKYLKKYQVPHVISFRRKEA